MSIETFAYRVDWERFVALCRECQSPDEALIEAFDNSESWVEEIDVFQGSVDDAIEAASVYSGMREFLRNDDRAHWDHTLNYLFWGGTMGEGGTIDDLTDEVGRSFDGITYAYKFSTIEAAIDCYAQRDIETLKPSYARLDGVSDPSVRAAISANRSIIDFESFVAFANSWIESLKVARSKKGAFVVV